MANTKILTLGHIIAWVTFKAVSLQLNGILMMRKIVQEMQDNAIQTARIHPAVHLGNGMKCSHNKISSLLTENYGTEPARLSYDHIENFIKFLEVWRDLGNRASPVNQAHMKRPLYC